MKYKYFLIAISIVLAEMPVIAQKKPIARKTTVVKYKIPKMSTLLGTYKDSVALPVAEVLTILGQPLKIIDVNQQVYSITNMQFLYRKRVVSETEDGKAIPAVSVVSQSFKSTPLPETWLSSIREQLKKGEELYFFDIIVKDTKGHILYAPNLKISIL